MNTTPMKQLLAYAGVAFLFVVLNAIFFVGLLGSDDALYWHAGSRLMDGSGFPESTHFGLRYPLVVPLGLIDRFWGMTEFRLAIPNYAYLLGIVMATLVALRDVLNSRQLFTFTLLFATLPLNVVGASIAAIDFAETFFISLSFLLFVRAVYKPQAAALLLFGSGVALGIATLARVTAPGVLLVYGVFFVFGAFLPRRVYLFGLLGFALPPVLEAVAYTLAGAGPFHRIDVVLGSHITGEYQRLAGISVATDGTGNLLAGKGLAAGVVAVLFNQEFALAFWAALCAILVQSFRWKAAGKNERLLLLFGSLLFSVWFLWISVGGFVRPLPRYYLPSAWIGLVLVGMWLGSALTDERLRSTMLSLLIATNLLALSLENIEPRAAAHVVEKLVANQDALVATDARTQARATQRLLLSAPDRAAQVVSGLGTQAVYFVYDPTVIADSPEFKNAVDQAIAKGEWTLHAEYPIGRRLSGQFLRWVHLDSVVPAKVADILLFGGQKVSVYRRGTGAGTASAAGPARAASP